MKHVTQRLAFGLSALVLLFFLAACSGPGGIGSSPTPTPRPPTPTPTPTPTPVTTQTYTGTGFTIGYPTGWTPQKQPGLGVAITDSLKVNAVSVFTSSALPGATAEQVATAESVALLPLVVQGAKPDTSVASTTTVGGDTWVQKAYTGTLSANGQSVPGRVYMLVDIHHGTAYTIIYGGPAALFDVENAQYFQPMLQSFKFTS